jgi:hypothetical protein
LDRKLIVGYTVDGQPLNQESYNKRLEDAEKQILEGKVISQEDLEKEVEKW